MHTPISDGNTGTGATREGMSVKLVVGVGGKRVGVGVKVGVGETIIVVTFG
jgi:hypothetical protein